jgi:hypothetical protein
VTLFLCDEAPSFVQLDLGDVQTAHHRIVEHGTTVADPLPKAHDRISVNASQPLNRSVCLSRGRTFMGAIHELRGCP